MPEISQEVEVKHEEKIASEFENLTNNLKEQYNTQKEIFERAGILEKLQDGILGIKAIDGKEYPFPKQEDLLKGVEEQSEIIKKKFKEGFTQLLIVPFGMKLEDLIEKQKNILMNHYQKKKLLSVNGIPLQLDEKDPFWYRERYHKADETGNIVYFPKEFSQLHKAQTKKEILDVTKQGFKSCLIEDLPNIPLPGKGKTINGRKQLEVGETPNKYLKKIRNDQSYKNELGFTPEMQITYSLLRLEKTNQVIDDSSVSYHIGAFFPDRIVPLMGWNQNQGYTLGRCHYDVNMSNRGARTFVEIPLPSSSNNNSLPNRTKYP